MLMMKPLIALSMFAAALPAWSQTSNAPQRPANEQVVAPQVERREVKLPKFPSKDFEVGLIGGLYSAETFGVQPVYGLRLGYHITEDFFVQGNFAQTKVNDEFYRVGRAGGLFAQPEVKLTYYNATAGWNVLPGEVFIGGNRAKATSVYLLGGVGSTKVAERRSSTLNFGVGMRLLLADRAGLHVELRDHVFSLDLIGRRQTMHNLELTGGFAWYF
jgi:outer membrane beta-barrel protein